MEFLEAVLAAEPNKCNIREVSTPDLDGEVLVIYVKGGKARRLPKKYIVKPNWGPEPPNGHTYP